MSAFRNVTQGLRNLWGQGGDDDEYEEDVAEETEDDYKEARASHREPTQTSRPAPARYQTESSDDEQFGGGERYQRFTMPAMPTASAATTQSNFDSVSSSSQGASVGSRKVRPSAMPLRSRDKNIYTLKPKSMDEASLAADYLKTGCAVVVNLDEVDRMIAVRIIDFMSGVCYGLENQGHAMKLGDTIFLFTPGDFEISSDETDYGENRDFIFKEETHEGLASSVRSKMVAKETAPAVPERRSWER